MRTRQLTLTLIIITALLTPIVHAVTIDGPTNFQGPHGGIVRYTTLSTTQINIAQGIWRLAGARSGAANLGAIGFDCSTGVTMTMQSLTRDQVRYTVAGTGTQYVYYRGRHPTTQLGAATMVYDDATGIATLTAPTGASVTIWYSQASTGLVDAQNIVILLLPLLVLAVAVNDFRNDMLGSGTVWRIVLMVAVFGFMAWLFASWGY